MSSIFFSGLAQSKISLIELDLVTSLSNSNSYSMIESGTKHCNKYFNSNKSVSSDSTKYENSFFCKFSKKRNRFYIYMLSVEKKEDMPLKEFCNSFLSQWPIVYDHMDKKLNFQRKEYLQGFFIENLFNKKVVNFSQNFKNDQNLIKNQIDNYILQNRFNFTNDNVKNNEIIENEIAKINRVYKKIISNSESNLDKVIKNQLSKIVRYKIFINDVTKFKSYSCNWKPENGFSPYIKLEKFSEFENI